MYHTCTNCFSGQPVLRLSRSIAGQRCGAGARIWRQRQKSVTRRQSERTCHVTRQSEWRALVPVSVSLSLSLLPLICLLVRRVGCDSTHCTARPERIPSAASFLGAVQRAHSHAHTRDTTQRTRRLINCPSGEATMAALRCAGGGR